MLAQAKECEELADEYLKSYELLRLSAVRLRLLAREIESLQSKQVINDQIRDRNAASS